MLHRLAHLNLTSDIDTHIQVQVGGGGFSDVFRSKMHSGWRPRPDSHIYDLLHLNEALNTETPTEQSQLSMHSNRLVVAVKRLRFWDLPSAKVEKVLFISSLDYLRSII